MSAREWKPGDVGAWSYLAGETQTALRVPGHGCRQIDAHEGRDHWHLSGGGWSGEDNNVRPLVVIDPEDLQSLSRLESLIDSWSGRVPYSDVAEPGDLSPVTALQAALREFANPTPPKPPEPQGLGAVVEDAGGRRWVRFGRPDSPPRWFDAGVAAGFPQKWENVAAVKVLSEGVPA